MFEIKIEPDSTILKRLLSGQDSRKQFDSSIEEVGDALSERMKRRVEAMLSKGHRFKVGATNTASENTSIEKSGSGSNTTWRVVEGDKTKANYFIRRGFGGSKSGKLPPYNKIREWVAAKGIVLRGEENTKTKLIRQRSSKGNWYARLRKSSERSVEEAAIDKIRKKIASFGSKYSHWNELYPQGQPRFDYAAEVLREESNFDPFFQLAGKYSTYAFIGWLSGKGRKNPGRVLRNF